MGARPDFIDHVYTKIGEPDPDTGFDFGLNRESRKIIAWGGTTPDDEETGLGARGVHRVWFFDLSAGPEAWGGNYDITNADLDGDDEPDYRIPVAWEYDAAGYRSPSELTGDLALVARYAAINLLFTSSALYPPYLSPDLLPKSINLDANTYEGWAVVDASATYVKTQLLLQEQSQLYPSNWSVDMQDLRFRGQAAECFDLWFIDEPCIPKRPQYPGGANLFLFNALNLGGVLDQGKGVAKRLYEAPAFNYATTEDNPFGLLGFADDNWIDGTQSFVFSFVSPGIVDSGYGLTTTIIHEYGHHFGMSHPHDGYDPTTGIDYEPTGPFFFAWAGDESNTIMSYIDVNWDYSQFDRDNAARQQAAAYIQNANVVAGRILSSKKANRAMADLENADVAVEAAEDAIGTHDYLAMFVSARAAYESVLAGADKANVKVTPSANGWVVLPKPKKKDAARAPILSYAAHDRIGENTKRGLG